MIRMCLAVLAGAILTGCAGRYRLTVPDAVTRPGEPAAVVVRLHRQEFGSLYLPVDEAVLRMRIILPALPANTAAISPAARPGPQRAAYTHTDGYAAAAVPAPKSPGRYVLNVRYQDRQGGQVIQSGLVYVLPARPTVVVDWEAIEDSDGAHAAGAALRRLAQAGVSLAYAVEGFTDPAGAHAWLKLHNLPDGPVVYWGRQAGQTTGSLAILARLAGGPLTVAGPEDDLLRAAGELGAVPAAVGTERDEFPSLPTWDAFVDSYLQSAPAGPSADKPS